MAGKGTRHRFELSRLEIAGVILSATTGLFVVFLLGIYAGRGLADRRPDGGEQIVRVPVAPAVEQTPGAGDGLTFYDTLGRPAGAAKPVRDEERRAPVPPPGEAIAKAPASVPAPENAPAEPADDEAPPADRVEVAKPSAPTKLEPAKPEPAKVAKEEPARPVAVASPAVLKAERPAPPSTARVAVALAPNAAATPAVRTGAKGDWSVQVSATRDPRTADAILRRLKTKGYDAFVLKVRRRGETFYRVRVGHYVSLEEAQQVVTRLRREPGVPEAFVASD